MPYLNTNKAKIYYETHGDAHQAIVFAHGVGGNSMAWWQQVPYFSQSYRVIVFDHRGFGRSTDDEKLGRSEFVNDLEALINHLDLENPILIGQSMGGISSSGYLARCPDNVSALVMADTLLGLEIPARIEEDLNAERAKHEHLSQIERAMAPSTVDSRPELPYLFSHLSAFNEVNRRTLTGDFGRVDLAQLADTGVPILFIAGSGDFLFMPHFIEAVKAEITGAEYREIKRTGHSPYFEDAPAFNQVLSDYLTTQGL